MNFRPNDIPILDVIDKVWVQYKKKWHNEYVIYEWWTLTSWWTITTDKNLVKDFSHNRPQGWCYSFVKSYLSLDDSGTYKWFCENFDNYNTQKDSIMDIWRWLQPLSDNSVLYLASRWIVADDVKKYTREYNGIACIVSVDWSPNGINSRTLEKEHTKRFRAYPWYSTSWVYRWQINKDKKYIIVVEWLIDFLTIAQHDDNVIWLKSAQDGRWEIRTLSKTYDLYIIFDNDESWKEWVNKMEWLSYYSFNRENAKDCKDINDVYNQFEAEGSIVEMIKTNSEFHTSTITKLETKRTYTRWVQEMDNEFWKIADRDLVIATAGTNQWKTTFINFLANKNWEYWKWVVYFTIELSKKDIVYRYAFTRVWLTKDQFNEWDYTKEQHDQMIKIINSYEKNFDLIDFEKAPSIDEICNTIVEMYQKKNKTLFIIDNLWNLETPWIASELEQQRYITGKLQELKNNHDICIILVHHNNKFKKKESISDHSLSNIRGNQKIADNSNIVIELSRSLDDTTWLNLLKISQHKDTQWWVTAHCYLEYKKWDFIHNPMKDD